jgi:two-component system cell cycle response regulator DivK
MSLVMTMGPAARVLLIDDHAASRRGYAEYLSSCGYDVLEAADGATGLTMAVTCSPDVIVLDLALPDIDGWSLARELRGAPATSAVPIIAFTGADLPHERASALRAGCDFHLAKPCSPPALLDALRRFAVPATSAGMRGSSPVAERPLDQL